MGGQLVLNQERKQYLQGFTEILLHLGSLSNGAYILVLQQKTKTSEVRFIVKK
jgi:hypothetical protein